MSVWNYITEKIRKEKALHFSLIDPDPLTQDYEEAGRIAKLAYEAGTDAIMVGGSTALDIDMAVKIIKENVKIPVILFPGSVAGISKHADAIFFMSLLNSMNPYMILGAQAIAAPLIKKIKIEPISMAYIVVEPGATAGYMGYAHLIPRAKPKIAAAYAMAAELIGYKLIYLEAGSGAEKCLPVELISAVSHSVHIPVIVGGGISTVEDAKRTVAAGASIIVQGTFVEKTVLKDGGAALREIIKAVKSRV
ncbi:MAG: geranylgeranylglyceryl/heptaprenylglyceryl phosphate synthase [Candidatus Odinarchaeota archaeon]